MSKTELTVGVNWLDLIFIRKYNYRLEDHEGNEITVSELNRYLPSVIAKPALARAGMNWRLLTLGLAWSHENKKHSRCCTIKI